MRSIPDLEKEPKSFIRRGLSGELALTDTGEIS